MYQHGNAKKRRRLNPPEAGPYVLRSVLKDIPLTTEDGSEEAQISCVEFWNDNLYIGTTASEIHHFVSIPADDPSTGDEPTYIRASRLQPAGYASSAIALDAHGVQRILLLPGPAKACVLCNGVVSFYSLPELSPAFPNREPAGVQWLGGIDENEDVTNSEGPTVMIANSKRILLARVGEKLKPAKTNIEYPSCLQSSRRGTIACVADSRSYALLEVEHQQKIPLFPISSTGDISDSQSYQKKDLRPQLDAHPARTSSLAHRGSATGDASGHNRSTSLGNLLSGGTARQPSPRAGSRNRSGLLTPDVESRSRSPASATLPERILPAVAMPEQRTRPRSSTEADPALVAQKPHPFMPAVLKPHILSPSPAEFLLTTGTGSNEPGVGLFVNLDGDVVRGSVEFARYPDAIVIDKTPPTLGEIQSSADTGEDSILALMDQSDGENMQKGIEAQPLSSDAAVSKSKSWLALPSESSRPLNQWGMQNCLSAGTHAFAEVSELLRLVRLRLPGQSPRISQSPPESTDPRTRASLQHVEEEKELFEASFIRSATDAAPPDWESKRNKEEAAFARSFDSSQSKVMVWSSNHIWRVLKNPLILQLENVLQLAVDGNERGKSINSRSLFDLLEKIRKRDAKTEVEFMTLNYIKQKVSLMLFLGLQTEGNNGSSNGDMLQQTESALIDGGLDPRVLLMLIPLLQKEVLQGPQGIWSHQGLAHLVTDHLEIATVLDGFATTDVYMMLKRFLSAWQGKRGFGSVADEQYVFDTVDAALLHLLLHLNQSLPPGSPAASSVSAKLNNVVDNWKGNFDRAVKLLEDYQWLFVLSRLYQSRKLSKDVLRTWQRIAEGEADAGGAMSASAAEVQVRRYLVRLGNTQLVEEYGLWLAARNPELAIEVFTDDSSRVKFSPQRITALLKNRAPGAVQRYLEHLVFKKNFLQFADDLIGYYLDSVLNVLEHSAEARDSVKQSYSDYRAMKPPKPTYLNFIAQNTPPEPWWQSRLRLLQLLGGGSYAASSHTIAKHLTYSIPTVLERLAPFSSYLVSESIILDARQGRHKEALRLLTHGLGDYDTAILYCYFGGPAPTSSGLVDASSLPSRDEQRDLFAYLLQEFLRIEDVIERMERTRELLGKFAAWFDPLQALAQIPESWSVDVMSEFLLRTFRTITNDKNEATVMKALCAAQNLQSQADLIAICEKLGPRLEGRSAADFEGDTSAVVTEGPS